MALPEPTTLLALMDRNWCEMWREIVRMTPGGWIVEAEGVVMCGSPRGSAMGNVAIVTRPIDAATVRAVTGPVYARAGLPYSVATRGHADGALQDELVEAGFTKLVDLPGMVLPAGEGTPPAGPPDLELRPVDDGAGVADFGRVMAEAYAVYGEPRDSTASHFVAVESVAGPTTRGFLGYRDGRPVAGAVLYLTHGVAGVGWVGTLPSEFGRGYGAAVTWRVVEEGSARGAAFASLQASPMGAAVYRRLGFSTPTHYRVFLPPR